MRMSRKSPATDVARARVSATEAAKNFGRLVDRVREDRVTYDVERGGKPVARIAPIDRVFTMADFKALARALPSGDGAYLKAVARASARHNRPRVRRNPWGR
jgi:antitoxin (DNA-binding transcriptional repressor) of toxin-antitoxin stability system